MYFIGPKLGNYDVAALKTIQSEKRRGLVKVAGSVFFFFFQALIEPGSFFNAAAGLFHV